MGPMTGSPEFQALDPATGGTFRSRRDTNGGETAVPPTPSSSLGIGCSSKESPLPCPRGLQAVPPVLPGLATSVLHTCLQKLSRA